MSAHGVGVDGPHGVLLEPTDVEVVPGEVVLVAGRPGAGHTALALTLGGRLRPDRGRVVVDGHDGRGAGSFLRRTVAIVDTPGVSEPDPALPLCTVVGEELAMAGRRAWPKQVRGWLDERGAGQWAGSRFEDVPAEVRLDLMLELAGARPGVEILVLTVPDRHGGAPEQWWQLASDRAGAGYAVVVTSADTSAQLLGVPCLRIGAAAAPRDAAAPPDTVAATQPVTSTAGGPDSAGQTVPATDVAQQGGPQPAGPQLDGAQLDGAQPGGAQQDDAQPGGRQLDGPELDGPQQGEPEQDGPQQDEPQQDRPQPGRWPLVGDPPNEPRSDDPVPDDRPGHRHGRGDEIADQQGAGRHERTDPGPGDATYGGATGDTTGDTTGGPDDSTTDPAHGGHS